MSLHLTAYNSIFSLLLEIFVPLLWMRPLKITELVLFFGIVFDKYKNSRRYLASQELIQKGTRGLPLIMHSAAALPILNHASIFDPIQNICARLALRAFSAAFQGFGSCAKFIS